MSGPGLHRPFPAWLYPEAWKWLNEDRSLNFDDSGPTTPEEFGEFMKARERRGDWIWLATYDDEPVGIIGYQPIAAHLGMMAGICFKQAVHGKGIAKECVRVALAEIFATGVSKISATYFTDNRRVAAFLAFFGSVKEGCLRRHAMRGGELVDMEIVGLFVK